MPELYYNRHQGVDGKIYYYGPYTKVIAIYNHRQDKMEGRDAIDPISESEYLKIKSKSNFSSTTAPVTS